MSVFLIGDHLTFENAEAALRDALDPSQPMYRSALATIHRCTTTVSAESYAKKVSKWLRFLTARSIAPEAATRDDVEDFKWSLAHLAPTTQSGLLSIVRTMYEEAIERKVVTHNPARGMKVRIPRRTSGRALSLAEARKILGSLEQHFGSPERELLARRNHLVLLFGLLLGPRSAEMRRLSFGDVADGSDAPVIRFLRKFLTEDLQSTPPRIAVAVRDFAAALSRHGVVAQPEDAIFMPLHGAGLQRARAASHPPLVPMDASTLYITIRDILLDNKVGGTASAVGSHRLRKTCATLAYLGGADPVSVQRLMAHQHLATTMEHYIVPADGLLAPAHQKILL